MISIMLCGGIIIKNLCALLSKEGATRRPDGKTTTLGMGAVNFGSFVSPWVDCEQQWFPLSLSSYFLVRPPSSLPPNRKEGGRPPGKKASAQHV